MGHLTCSIDRTAWKLCAASVDYSSKLPGDRARSSVPHRAARGAGFRARRRLEPPLCRAQARRRAVTGISITLSLEGRGRLARSTRCPAPSRQGEPFNFSRQVITHTRRSSRFGRPQIASRLRERMCWSISPIDEFVGVWIACHAYLDPLGRLNVAVTPDNLEAYRELARAALMEPFSGFLRGPEAVFRFTNDGWERRQEPLAALPQRFSSRVRRLADSISQQQ